MGEKSSPVAQNRMGWADRRDTVLRRTASENPAYKGLMKSPSVTEVTLQEEKFTLEMIGDALREAGTLVMVFCSPVLAF